MKSTLFFGVFSTALTLMSGAAQIDCLTLSLAVKRAVAAEQSQVLEIVSTQVAAAPACSCEIVKAAIEGSLAKPATVADIVEAAATVAPEHLRLISQCAVAAAPDALLHVQTVLAKLDPNRGEPSGKSSKDSKSPAGEVAAMFNPLDFPGQGPVGPTTGGPGSPSGTGGEILVPVFPPIIINPPNVTSVNG
ncbi:MAG: hypothetical protein RLZZ282_1212 [Verrucomicrobiota bacterium]